MIETTYTSSLGTEDHRESATPLRLNRKLSRQSSSDESLNSSTFARITETAHAIADTRHAPITASTIRRLSHESTSASCLSKSAGSFEPPPLGRSHRGSIVGVSLSGYSFVLFPNRHDSKKLAADYDSTIFLAEDPQLPPSKARRSSIFSPGAYGSDFYSLSDDAQGDSDFFSLAGISSDYRVPTGYFGQDTKYNNFRESNLANFQKKTRRKCMKQTTQSPKLDEDRDSLSSVETTDVEVRRRGLQLPHLTASKLKSLGYVFSKRSKGGV